MSFEGNKSFQKNENLEEDFSQKDYRDDVLEKFPFKLIDLLEECSLEEVKEIETLYSKIPKDLQMFWEERWVEEKADPKTIISDLEKINRYRSREGFEKITGYHVSNKDLKEGSYLQPDQNGEVFYSEDIKNLYGKYSQGWLYAVEGTSDDKVINEDLGWRTTKGKLKIVGKVPLNKDTQKDLGWDLADCEYH